MKTTTKMLLVLIALLAQISITACSDDGPGREDDPEEWRKDLFAQKNLMCHAPMCGIPDLSFTPSIGIVDQNNKDLLDPKNPNNVLKSDFYFEYQGNKYFYYYCPLNFKDSKNVWLER